MAAIFTRDNILFMLDGLKLTILIAGATMILSLFLGTLLAMIRNDCKGKMKWLSVLASWYIEFFRCTPNVLWILLFRFAMKGDPLYIGIFTFTLFTSAVVAEIVRGGMNAVGKGQIEGAHSQGFGFFQTMIYIVLPQTYKMIIPALLSQCTTIIKDTSFLKAVDIQEFMRNSSVVLGQAKTAGEILALYGFVLLTYFILNFALSLAVRAYQKHMVTI